MANTKSKDSGTQKFKVTVQDVSTLQEKISYHVSITPLRKDGAPTKTALSKVAMHSCPKFSR
jgi:hypothetical protein